MKKSCFLILLAMCAAGVQALPFNGPINADPYAMTQWRNVTSFDATNTNHTQYANINVAYAVYRSADFTASGGFDPSNGYHDYVYAFQIWNEGTSTTNVDFFGLNITGAALNGIPGYDGHKAIGGGVTPSAQLARWNFPYEPFGPGKHSLVLFFTSDHAPKMGTATLKSGDFITQNLEIPVPSVPEPLTIGLLGLGGLSLIRRKK